MSYKIIEVHQIYTEGAISEIAVLWESNTNGWVRSSYCTTKPCSGYKFIMPGEALSAELIQQIAGQGMNLPDSKKKIYFPGKRNWDR